LSKPVYLNRDLGFIRIGAAVPSLRVADVDFNVATICAAIQKAAAKGIQVLAFPEMALTGYTIGDLVQQQALLEKAEMALNMVAQASRDTGMLIIIGLPLCIDQKIFNCAAVINSGHILGIIPKTYLPSYKEFYESRWFVSGEDACSDMAHIGDTPVPFGTNILFSIHGLAFYATELASDLHAFYRDCRVISDENVSPALSCARLRLVAATKAVFARVLGILGMSAPDSM